MPPEETTAPAAAAPAMPALETATIITPVAGPVAEVTASVAEEPAEVAAAPEPAAAATEVPAEAARPAEEAKSALHTDTPSLLEEAGKPKEEAKKPDSEPKPAETAVEGPKYEPFKLPEGVQPDEKRLGEFAEVAAKHGLKQEDAQALLDMHTSTLKQFQDAVFAEQHRVFAETRRGWVQQILADPILGGAGHETAKMAAARMRDLLVPEAHRAEFAAFMRDTGAGDHPALFRLLHNAARLFDEPAAPPIPARPVPDRGGNGKQPRGTMLYDHPTSRRAAGRA